MGVRIKGGQATIASLSNKAKRGSKLGEQEVRKQTQRIVMLARQYAPRRDGHLESAQNIRASKDERRGVVFQRKVLMGGRPVTVAGKTRDVDEYLEIIHEKIGWEKLGPRSIRKGAASGKPVGDRFLSRAAKDLEEDVVKQIKNAIRRGFQT